MAYYSITILALLSFVFRRLLPRLPYSRLFFFHLDLFCKQDQTKLFHRSVISRKRNFNQHSFKKATGKLRMTLKSSSQATILLSDRQFMAVSWMVFITLSKWVATFWRFQKINGDPSSAWIFSSYQSWQLRNYIMKRICKLRKQNLWC